VWLRNKRAINRKHYMKEKKTKGNKGNTHYPSTLFIEGRRKDHRHSGPIAVCSGRKQKNKKTTAITYSFGEEKKNTKREHRRREYLTQILFAVMRKKKMVENKIS